MTTNAAPIEVRERSTARLVESNFRRLERSDAFLRLVEQGVVSLVRTRDAPFGIKATSYVGRAILEDDVALSVREKSSGALLNLLKWSVPEDIREFDVASPIGDQGQVLDAFARRFLEYLGYYVGHGRIKEYRTRSSVESIPRGRIDLRKTAGLRARGEGARLSLIRQTLTADILPNQLLAAALVVVERGLGAAPVNERELALARTYAPLFADVNRGRATGSRRATLSSLFRAALADRRAMGDLKRALEYSRAILLSLGTWPKDERDQTVPQAFFMNLESLFESAVIRALSDATGLAVSDGSSHEKPLFPSLPERYVADPDFVVIRSNGSLLCGDCKYKELDKLPEHSDVYQLVAHCVAFGSTRGLLVYPGQTLEAGVIGTTSQGIRVAWAMVRISHLKEDLATVFALDKVAG